MDDGAKMALRDGAASAQEQEERRDVPTVGSTMPRTAVLTFVKSGKARLLLHGGPC